MSLGVVYESGEVLRRVRGESEVGAETLFKRRLTPAENVAVQSHPKVYKRNKVFTQLLSVGRNIRKTQSQLTEKMSHQTLNVALKILNLGFPIFR